MFDVLKYSFFVVLEGKSIPVLVKNKLALDENSFLKKKRIFKHKFGIFLNDSNKFF